MNKQNYEWWQKGIIYHIYPQSFYDTNGDGIGDLQGIRQKLDYLKALGINAIWLSPVYLSPLHDGGYDISDYTAIHPRYGTMEDFRQLLHEAHARNIRIIMDLVLNHTSTEHPWFKESRSSLNNPKRDWYIWHPGKNGRKPNNWHTNFGQNAWTKDPQTSYYYHHSFFTSQPDLNWRNPQVKKAIFNIIRFWLALGVDGFRLDVANMLYKDASFRNNPPLALFSNDKAYNRNQPETFSLYRELRLLMNRYPGRITIGEVYVSPPGNSKLAASYLGNGRDMLHMAFDFTLIFTRMCANRFYKRISEYYQALPTEGWPCFVFSNHDLGRTVNHYLLPFNKHKKARLLATLLLTLKGTPFIYYGDEIGMQNCHIPRNKIHDPYGKRFYPIYQGRDKARTPMQWNAGTHAGFSRIAPWLPLHPNYTNCNLEEQQNQPNSIYNYYQKLIYLRNKNTALQTGDIQFLNKGENGYLLYARSNKEQTIYIALNFSPFNKKIKELPMNNREVLHTFHPDSKSTLPFITSFEAILFR